MKRRSSISIGPGAASLILIFVMLSMSVLAMLSVMTARGDLRLAERSVEVAETVYALNSRSEQTLGKLAAVIDECRASSTDEDSFLRTVVENLPEGMVLENADGRFAAEWTEEDEAGSIDCAAWIGTYDTEEQVSWCRHNLTMGTEDEWNF